jgi:hypothetical protein
MDVGGSSETSQHYNQKTYLAEGLQIESRKPAAYFLVYFNEMQRIRHISLIHCSAILTGTKVSPKR